ncbi:MAG: guanylate kinase [Proteobacteria bacterium]|nr:guanylate kinase [Pseudomonadota bacterium]
MTHKASNIKRRGLMLALSSPSGAGKSSISRALLAHDSGLHLSISVTSRPIRQGEVDGEDYHFVSKPAFEDMVKQGAFLEHALVFGNLYGSPKATTEQQLVRGRDVLFDIDWQGTQSLKAKMRDDLVTVFILPPSFQELESRLRRRGRDSEEDVVRRMAKAADELSHFAEYDYIVINTDFDHSVQQVLKILAAERLKRHRQNGLTDFVRGLQEGN